MKPTSPFSTSLYDVSSLSRPTAEDAAQMTQRLQDRRHLRERNIQAHIDEGAWPQVLRAMGQEPNLAPWLFEHAVAQAAKNDDQAALQALAPLAPTPQLRNLPALQDAIQPTHDHRAPTLG